MYINTIVFLFIFPAIFLVNLSVLGYSYSCSAVIGTLFHCYFVSYTLKQKSAVHPPSQKKEDIGHAKHQYFDKHSVFHSNGYLVLREN